VRRYLIRRLLPLLFCLVPLGAGALIAAALPDTARKFYLHKLTPLDLLILGLGSSLFLLQTIFCWRALQWQGSSFHEASDPWISNLAQAAEWFPLLGLIGTVAGIMQTFATFETDKVVTQGEVISRYAPAITATCSGLFMALVNILPTWIVLVGRDVILTLTGDVPASKLPPATKDTMRMTDSARDRAVAKPPTPDTSRR